MKKKVMCMLLTGVMAASMFAGCGSSDTADTTTDAAATTDAATITKFKSTKYAKYKLSKSKYDESWYALWSSYATKYDGRVYSYAKTTNVSSRYVP